MPTAKCATSTRHAGTNDQSISKFHGNVHGGNLLKLLDQIAYACASHYSNEYIVTLSANQVIFKKTIYMSELITFTP
ncbi:hotdog domain-containing protein [Snodgrassella gandavensis]|uniref:hotdog domain-containing protein n=1 Tax=Snodgrassella gandavensis TaxID=2946698 RepID=UPI001EF45083|nr:hotdog domain-containing protein [Snodgrassella gandavensis]